MNTCQKWSPPSFQCYCRKYVFLKNCTSKKSRFFSLELVLMCCNLLSFVQRSSSSLLSISRPSHKWKINSSILLPNIWDKVCKSGLSKFCGRQPLKNLLSPFLNTLSHMIHFTKPFHFLHNMNDIMLLLAYRYFLITYIKITFSCNFR